MKKIKLVKNSNNEVVRSYLSGDLPDEIFADFLEEQGVPDNYSPEDIGSKLLKVLRTAPSIQFEKRGRKEIVDQLRKDGYL